MGRRRRTLDNFEDDRKRDAQYDWVTPYEASRITGLGVSTLAKMRMAGEGPPFSRPLPNAVRYSRKELQVWMESKRVPAAAE